MIPAFVFDLDGILADCSHRLPLLPDYDAFFAACDKDKPILPVIKTALALAIACDIWIVSGRSEVAREDTERWLELNRLKPEWLKFMRKKGDHRPDNEVKQEWLSLLPDEDRKRIVAVFDDRDRVVDMWRRNGLKCFQAAPGNF